MRKQRVTGVKSARESMVMEAPSRALVLSSLRAARAGPSDPLCVAWPGCPHRLLSLVEVTETSRLTFTSLSAASVARSCPLAAPQPSLSPPADPPSAERSAPNH